MIEFEFQTILIPSKKNTKATHLKYNGVFQEASLSQTQSLLTLSEG